MKITHIQKNKKGGFTMVEMLVAVFIFTVSLVALTLVSAKGLRASREAQNQVQADYLALEAIEVVRNIRDSAFISGYGENAWTGVFNGLDVFSGSGCYSDGGTCNFYFDSDRMVLQTCESCEVYYNTSTNSYFQPESGEELGPNDESTIFNRTIVFDSPGGDTEVFITVLVTWPGGEVEYTENLHLWL